MLKVSGPPTSSAAPEAVEAVPANQPLAAASEKLSPNADPAVVSSQAETSRQRDAGFTIQLGTFASLDAAARSARAWEQRGYAPYVVPSRNSVGRAVFAVRVGEYVQRSAADREAGRIASREKVAVSVVSAFAGEAVAGFDGGAP